MFLAAKAAPISRKVYVSLLVGLLVNEQPAWIAWVCKSCLPLVTFGYLFLPLLTFAYLSLLILTFPYLSLPFLTFSYLWLPLVTLVTLGYLGYLWLPLVDFPHLRLPFLTFGYLWVSFLTFPNLSLQFFAFGDELMDWLTDWLTNIVHYDLLVCFRCFYTQKAKKGPVILDI